jgi:hypothetical protein
MVPFADLMIRIRFIICGFFLLLQLARGTTSEKSLKYFNKTEAGVSFGIGSFKTDIINGTQKKIKNDELVINFQTINGVKYMNRLGVGISVGLEKWRNGFFWPIYGVITFDLKPADNTFFADLYLGYSIGNRYATTFYKDGTGAFGLSVGVGYKMKVAGKINFMYEVFYRYQAIESSYGIYVSDSVGKTPILRSTVDYKVPLHFAGFKIGVIIP